MEGVRQTFLTYTDSQTKNTLPSYLPLIVVELGACGCCCVGFVCSNLGLGDDTIGSTLPVNGLLKKYTRCGSTPVD